MVLRKAYVILSVSGVGSECMKGVSPHLVGCKGGAYTLGRAPSPKFYEQASSLTLSSFLWNNTRKNVRKCISDSR